MPGHCHFELELQLLHFRFIELGKCFNLSFPFCRCNCTIIVVPLASDSGNHSRDRHPAFGFHSSPFQPPLPPMPLSSSSSSSFSSKPRIVAEYAKSNRSACKSCSEVISAKALRLGLVSRDSRGFDFTKWHHLNCFRESVDSVDLIGGFASLQGCDQEALKRLVGVRKSSLEEVLDGDNYMAEEIQNLESKRKAEGGQEAKLEERNSKGAKLMANNEAQLGVDFLLSDIRDKYKAANLLPKWKAFQTVIFLERDDGLHDSSKIAAFDFDGCLAKTSVKRVGADAWSLMYPSIPEKLQSLYKDGYKLVIFTNESNIDRWKNKRQVAVDSKLGRLQSFIKCVKVPIQVFIACGYSDGKVEDPYRKPRPGMWQIMEKYFNSGISVDMDQSFYVGDAAGRPDDHSDADIKFAEAIGLKFHLPEDYFGPIEKQDQASQ